jgi:cytochrome c
MQSILEETMMNNIIYVLFAGAMFISGSAFATEDMALVKEKGCMDCHSLDKNSHAPSFQSIAKKYNKDKDPGLRLVKQIMGGSDSTIHRGMKMPPAGDMGSSRSPNARPSLTKEEAEQLTAWVLSQQ